MKVRVTQYKAIFWDVTSHLVYEKEGYYTGVKFKTDISKWAKDNGLKLLGVSGRSKVMTEIEAPLFMEIADADGEGVQSND